MCRFMLNLCAVDSSPDAVNFEKDAIFRAQGFRLGDRDIRFNPFTWSFAVTVVARVARHDELDSKRVDDRVLAHEMAARSEC